MNTPGPRASYSPGRHEGRALDSLEVARRIVDLASDKQAEDIVLLDIRQISLVADYFVICSGGSERQISAIQRQIEDGLEREARISPRQREGKPDSGWVLLDYGDVIVHILAEREREYYRLEDLWGAAIPVVRMQ